MYQSPYKGFNRNKKMEDFMIKQVEGINPPIRGSIAKNCLTIYTPMTDRINPPIRGSIVYIPQMRRERTVSIPL